MVVKIRVDILAGKIDAVTNLNVVVDMLKSLFVSMIVVAGLHLQRPWVCALPYHRILRSTCSHVLLVRQTEFGDCTSTTSTNTLAGQRVDAT